MIIFMLNTNKIVLISIVAIASLIVVSCDNVHRRGIYYSRTDGICYGGTGTPKDMIQLNITIDGQRVVKYDAFGFATCDQAVTDPAASIVVYPVWHFTKYDSDNPDPWYRFADLGFVQQVKKYYQRTKLTLITAQITINPDYKCVIDEKHYKCEIVGDGQIHHYGVNEPDQPPCVCMVKCNKIANPQVIQK